MQNDLLINSKDTLYKGIGDLIFTSDISFGNLESPLTTLAKQEFIFSDKEAPPTYISQEQFNVLKGSEGRKFTIMSTACNHACDYGFEGVNTTIEKLKDDDIIPVGTNLNSGNQEKATIIKVKDITVGVIAFTFGLNGKKIPVGKDYCVNRTNLNEVHGEVDLSLVKKQIEDCKTKRCDVILLSLHWGLEYEFYPTQRQMEVAHLLVEEGVDLIISHHPHVIQPVEYYQTKRDANRKAVICYSLGNLINPFSDLHLSVSLIMRMAFVKGIIGGETRTYINNCELYPIFQRVDVSNELPQVYLEKLSEISLEGEQKEKVNKIVSILGDKIYSNHDLTDKVKSYY